MQAVDDIIARMIKATGAKNQAEMLEKLEFSSGTASVWKKREKIPDGSILKAAELTGVNTNWLKTGEGSPNLAEQYHIDIPHHGRTDRAPTPLYNNVKEAAEAFQLSADMSKGYYKAEELRNLNKEKKKSTTVTIAGTDTQKVENSTAGPYHLLRDVILEVEAELTRRSATLSPDKKAELISLLCEEFAEETKVDKEKVKSLIKLAM